LGSACRWCSFHSWVFLRPSREERFGLSVMIWTRSGWGADLTCQVQREADHGWRRDSNRRLSDFLPCDQLRVRLSAGFGHWVPCPTRQQILLARRSDCGFRVQPTTYFLGRRAPYPDTMAWELRGRFDFRHLSFAEFRADGIRGFADVSRTSF